MVKSLTVQVEPNVLRWLRQSAGWEIEEVSRKLKLPHEAIVEFENGKRLPTLAQIKTLSVAYKRPIAMFFLPKPRQEKPHPQDYRQLPDRKDIFEKETILAFRKARSLQAASKELSSNLGIATKPKITRAKASDNPVSVAKTCRELFKLDSKKQITLRDHYAMFAYLRDLMEERNILVFQISMPLSDARGFTLADEWPIIIVINQRDLIQARVFTLMHEFAHVLLGETAVDIPEQNAAVTGAKRAKDDDDNTERWCDRFATAFLLPDEFAKELFKQNINQLTDTATLKALSRKTKVSKAVLLISMHNMGYISKAQYESVLQRYKEEEEELIKKEEVKAKKQKGGPPQDRKVLSQYGTRFVTLVAENLDVGSITYSDALDYLAVKSEHFDKILEQTRLS